MVFLLCLLKIIFFISLIITLLLVLVKTIVIELKINKLNINLNENSIKNKKIIDKSFLISIEVRILKKVPIFILKITNKNIQKIKSSKRTKDRMRRLEKNVRKNKEKINKNIVESIKKIKVEFRKIKIEANIGTENSSATAILVGIISMFLAIFYTKFLSKNDFKNFKVKPIYIGKNELNINAEGIISIKLIHIIEAICILYKKGGKNKNDRTPNRRSYGYSYE